MEVDKVQQVPVLSAVDPMLTKGATKLGLAAVSADLFLTNQCGSAERVIIQTSNPKYPTFLILSHLAACLV